MFERIARIIRAQQKAKEVPAYPKPTIDALQPGDAITLWAGGDVIIETVLDCQETLRERTTNWRWLFLSDNKMLELAPDGNILYQSSEIFYQGSEPFQELTAEVKDGGLLKTFEDRVREGNVATNPVIFRHARRHYQIKSTGTFRSTIKGKPLDREVWKDISPNEGDNVYFETESSGGEKTLGIWTTHVAFLSGNQLQESDITNLYRAQRKEVME